MVIAVWRCIVVTEFVSFVQSWRFPNEAHQRERQTCVVPEQRWRCASWAHTSLTIEIRLSIPVETPLPTGNRLLRPADNLLKAPGPLSLFESDKASDKAMKEVHSNMFRRRWNGGV